MAATMISRTPIFSPPHSSRKNKSQLLRTPTENINSLSINNDEEEKRQRKRSTLLSNNLLSPIAGRTTPGRSRVTTATSDLDPERTHVGMTYAQLKEHNANCVKLSSENKINSKNAFSLHLIDYMKFLVTQSEKDDNTTNFQVASCTLDAGVKIYAGRVDSVHADAYKILGSLGRANDVQSGDENTNADEVNNNKEQRKKKTNRGPGKTIEKNIKALNCDKFDLTFEVDPFFHKTSASFDEGGAGGLLLNNLLIKDESYELILDSRVELSTDKGENNTEESSLINLTPFRDISTKLFEDGTEICPQFADFKFSNWDRNAEDVLGAQIETSFREDENHRFDMDASALEPDYDVGDNDGGYLSDNDVGAGGDDGAYEDNFMENTAVADASEAIMVADGRSGNMRGGGVLGPLQLSLSLNPSEYSYFCQDILDTWAGPQHWKVKPRSKDASRNETENADKSKRRRQKKLPFTFNYDSDSKIKDIANPGKVAKTLAKSTLNRMTKLQTTLPDDLHYDADNFLKLFIKSCIKVQRQFRPAENEDDNDCYDYNYNNDYDRENFCPELQDGDDDDDAYGAADDATCNNMDTMYNDSCGNSMNPGADNTFFGGENLVSQPDKVEKIQIAYAKTAKKIDIRKLKTALWETLTVPETDTEKIPEKTVEIEQPQLIKLLEDRKIDGMQSFKEIYKNLPNKLSHSASKNLSVPIAFVCMLYLANEKELTLTGQEDMMDFNISK